MGSVLGACLVMGITLHGAVPPTAPPAPLAQRALRVAQALEHRARRTSIPLRQRMLRGAATLAERWVHRAGPNSALNFSRFASTRTALPRVRAVVFPLAPVVAMGTLMTLEAAQRGVLDPVMEREARVRDWVSLLSSREPEE